MHISVAIVVQDEEDRLPDCLQSVAFADDVVVVDSGSRDRTVEIARSFGCRVFFQTWLGYARQKQFAVDQCRHHWVLILDADERAGPRAARTIDGLTPNRHEFAAYSFARKNFFHQRWIRHCGWWPDRVIRLVNRHRGKFSDNLVHERWVPDGAVRALDECIEHYSFRNYSDLIHKLQVYSSLSAREMRSKGRQAGWWSPISHGFWMFFKTYVFKLGILDGFDGLVISLLNAGGSFMKYAKLRESYLAERNTPDAGSVR